MFSDIQEDCDGFLYEGNLDIYKKSDFLVDCDNEEFTDLVLDKVSSFVPVAGEFPMVEQAGTTESDVCLTRQSVEAFSTMSETEYCRWWGVNLNAVAKHPSKVDTSVICVSGGIWNYGNILSLVDNDFQEYPVMIPFRCRCSCNPSYIAILQCIFPVLQLRVYGYPETTSQDNLLRLLRLFAPVYAIEMKENCALLYVSPESGSNEIVLFIVAYTLLMELHAHVVNHYRLLFSFSLVCNKTNIQSIALILISNSPRILYLFALTLRLGYETLLLHI